MQTEARVVIQRPVAIPSRPCSASRWLGVAPLTRAPWLS